MSARKRATVLVVDEVTPAGGITGEATDALVEGDHLREVETPHRGHLRKDISNAMVGLKKQLYGRGPTKARTYINDNIVFCVLQGGLTRNEQTLIAAGEERLVREFRLRFQEAMGTPTMAAVEELTGRKVLTYQSQIVFDPDHSFEIFVLDGEPSRGGSPAEGS
jgi:uncharacterized protein YbcI